MKVAASRVVVHNEIVILFLFTVEIPGLTYISKNLTSLFSFIELV